MNATKTKTEPINVTSIASHNTEKPLTRGQKAARTRKENEAKRKLQAALATDKPTKASPSPSSSSSKTVNPECKKMRDITLKLRPAIEKAGGKITTWNSFSFSVKLPDWDAFLKVTKGKDKAPFRKLHQILRSVEGFKSGQTAIVHREMIIPFLKAD